MGRVCLCKEVGEAEHGGHSEQPGWDNGETFCGCPDALCYYEGTNLAEQFGCWRWKRHYLYSQADIASSHSGSCGSFFTPSDEIKLDLNKGV